MVCRAQTESPDQTRNVPSEGFLRRVGDVQFGGFAAQLV